MYVGGCGVMIVESDVDFESFVVGCDDFDFVDEVVEVERFVVEGVGFGVGSIGDEKDCGLECCG